MSHRHRGRRGRAAGQPGGMPQQLAPQAGGPLAAQQIAAAQQLAAALAAAQALGLVPAPQNALVRRPQAGGNVPPPMSQQQDFAWMGTRGGLANKTETEIHNATVDVRPPIVRGLRVIGEAQIAEQRRQTQAVATAGTAVADAGDRIANQVRSGSDRIATAIKGPQRDPDVYWVPTESQIVAGTPLDQQRHLNATAKVPGTAHYRPVAGT